MKTLRLISLLFIIIGGLNWGSVGVSNFNFIELLPNKKLIKLIYIVIGISTIYIIFNHTLVNSITSKETGPLNNPDYFGILDRQGMLGPPVIDDVKIRWNSTPKELVDAVNAGQ